MIEVHLLGTGGMIPLPERHLTSLYVKYKGSGILIDCGEGTQVAIRKAGLGFKRIDMICFTHFHADHIAGLPGLLLTIGNSGRTNPVTVIGPRCVSRIVECLCVIAPELPYKLDFVEIETSGPVITLDSLTVSAREVRHRIPCYAYKLSIKRPGRFHSQKAVSLGIPKQYWSILQAGNHIEINGKQIDPSSVMGEPRKGITVSYATDLRPSDELVSFIHSSDLFICEGMYGDPDMQEKAIGYRHCMFSEAAVMAKNALVKRLWLTHFSPSMPDPEKYIEYAANIFPKTYIDEKKIVLTFQRGPSCAIS